MSNAYGKTNKSINLCQVRSGIRPHSSLPVCINSPALVTAAVEYIPGKNVWTPDEGLFSNHNDVANSNSSPTSLALIQDQTDTDHTAMHNPKHM